jgi:hypothetical protein
MGNLCCAREHSVQFFVQFVYTVKLYSLTESVWGPLRVSFQTFCVCWQNREGLRMSELKTRVWLWWYYQLLSQRCTVFVMSVVVYLWLEKGYTCCWAGVF